VWQCLGALETREHWTRGAPSLLVSEGSGERSNLCTATSQQVHERFSTQKTGRSGVATSETLVPLVGIAEDKLNLGTFCAVNQTAPARSSSGHANHVCADLHMSVLNSEAADPGSLVQLGISLLITCQAERQSLMHSAGGQQTASTNGPTAVGAVPSSHKTFMAGPLRNRARSGCGCRAPLCPAEAERESRDWLRLGYVIRFTAN